MAGPSLTVVVAWAPPLGVSADRPQPASASAVAVSAALPITSRRRMLWVNMCCLLTRLLLHPRFVPQLSRSTSCVASTSFRARDRSPDTRSCNRCAAIRPNSAIGCRTVVSPGDTYRAAITSSHPVTTMSPGTPTPAARNVASAASASSSFAHTSPSGRSLVALSICWATSTPASSVSGTRSGFGTSRPRRSSALPKPAYRSETSYELAGSPTKSRLVRPWSSSRVVSCSALAELSLRTESHPVIGGCAISTSGTPALRSPWIVGRSRALPWTTIPSTRPARSRTLRRGSGLPCVTVMTTLWPCSPAQRSYPISRSP